MPSAPLDGGCFGPARASGSGVRMSSALSSAASSGAGAAKAKAASKAGLGSGDAKARTQMHRRSRTGCFTCRLRRKKCDEGSPVCTACRHLGLQCEYKRPVWWSNNEARRQHKDDIKNIIKRRKLADKAPYAGPPLGSLSPPPGLSHSLPSSATLTDLDALDRTRSASVDSFPFRSPPRALAAGPTTAEYGGVGGECGGGEYGGADCGADYGADYRADCGADYGSQPPPPPELALAAAGYSPYEIDVKTERQMFVDDVPTLRESHVATFSTYQPPPPAGTVLAAGHLDAACWADALVDHERCQALAEEALNPHFFDFAHGRHAGGTRQVRIELEDNDRRLLQHFIQFVLPTIFPILDSNQHGSVGSDLVLPALQSNGVYLHCCLSIAAQHLKSAQHRLEPRPDDVDGDVDAVDADIDQDIMRHRYATIYSLCEALRRDEDHQQILEATLGLIFFQCVVGRLDDDLLDIAWHQHFQAAISLVQKLDLPRLVSAGHLAQTPFNMTLTAWIDILGATMQGSSPTFAHTYREKHLSAHGQHQLGLRELMGCEDRVMYLISEIACLESLKTSGMDDLTLCQHVSALGEQLSLTEVGEAAPRPPYGANGSLSPKQLSRNVTAAFRLAARVYLCSLVPGFSPAQPSPAGLVEKLAAVLRHVPAGAAGFDRSLVWVYLVGGAVSLPGSGFRALFEDRVARLGDDAGCGSFGRMASLLREVWLHNDGLAQQQQQQQTAVTTPGSCVSDAAAPQQQQQQQQPQYVHWRKVMQMKGWDYLLL